MSIAKKLAGTAAAVLVLGLAPIGPSVVAKAAAADRLQLSMMDEMKSDSSKSGSMGNMGQPGGQQQNMGGGGMQDNRMRMQMPGQMQDCQGPGCQQGSSMQGSSMMQMMERMHRQMNSGMMPGGNTASGPADVTERLEGRIAFLKAELQITDKQLSDWNVLADALRSSRQHLLEARKLLVMDDKMPGTERLDHYERHLSERLEAIKSARAAFSRLYGTLNESQKKTADALLLPLIATF